MKNKKILSLGLAAAMLVSVLAAPVNVNAGTVEPEGNEQKQEYVIAVDKNQQEFAEKLLPDTELVQEDYDIALYTSGMSEEAAEKLNDADNGITVEPNVVFSASTVTETQEPTIEEELARIAEEERVAALNESLGEQQKWNIQMVNGYSVAGTSGTNEVKIAVLDSGIDFISDVPVEKSINLVEDEQDITYYMNDMTGHGTSVASVIHEIDPNALIYSVRILDENNEATLDRVIEGICWCMENDVDIINMSFGSTYNSSLLQQTIQEAKEQGIVFVGAAGNNNAAGVEYPAAYEEVLSVGSINYKGEKENSATGNGIDVVAPGNDIISQTMFGLYTCSDGTSLAAAHVTGVAGLLLSKDTSVTGEFIGELLKQTAIDMGNSRDYGSGLIDLDYAESCYDEFKQVFDEDGVIVEDAEAIEANSNDVQNFSMDDVTFCGRWNTTGHNALTDLIDGYSVTEAQMKALKQGGVFPDLAKAGNFGVSDSSFSSVIWHGGMTQNYISCYRYITKLGSMTGSISTITQGVKGLPQTAFDKMTGAITDYTIDGIGWANVMGTDIYNNTNGKSDMKKAFIYGIAIHSGSDAFAHASYRKLQDGTYERITHDNLVDGIKEADNVSVVPERFTDAKAFARRVITHYLGSEIGGILDFRTSQGTNKAYVLGEAYECAYNANQRVASSAINTYYGDFSYDDPSVTVSYTAMPQK